MDQFLVVLSVLVPFLVLQSAACCEVVVEVA
jgi:hypothetical protein